MSLLLTSTVIYAQQPAKLPHEPEVKELRVPTDERLTEISQNPDYNYNEDVKELSLLQRFRLWLMNKLGEWLDVNLVQTVLKVLSILAIIVVILLLVNQITEGQLRNALTRRRNRTLLDLRYNGKVVPSNQLDQLIEQTILEKKFGLAVRYLYQKALVLLRDEELIRWKQDKTNHEYLYELGDHPAASHFDRLTYFYEYVDYGDFAIDEYRFLQIKRVFDEFRTLIPQKA